MKTKGSQLARQWQLLRVLESFRFGISIEDLAKKAQKASLKIANLETEIKNKALENIETALKECKTELSLEDRIVTAGREFGVYLNRFALVYKRQDIAGLNEPFIARFKNSYCVIKIEKDDVKILSNKSPDNISREEFLSLWQGDLISVPAVNVLLARYVPLNSSGRIVCVYSYHNEEFYLFRKIFSSSMLLTSSRFSLRKSINV